MRSLIDKILSQQTFKDQPPVLVDVGASYHIYPLWDVLAPHAICLAFDPDLREMTYLEGQEDGFKKLYKFPNIVSEKNGTGNFYLTDSPYCSSSLKPDISSLEGWEFQDMFQVKETISLNAITLMDVLGKLELSYLDWIKLDTQGTDLRIFKSLDQQVQDQVLAVDFEPGVVDAYQGEDKLYHVLEYMDQKDFWVTDLEVKGVRRSSVRINDNEDLTQLKNSPCWAEVTFLNSLSELNTERSLMLSWIFSTILKQHGFALEVAKRGIEHYENELFKECIEFSRASMRPLKKSFIQKLLSYLVNKLRRWEK